MGAGRDGAVVSQLYETALGRVPDLPGLQIWTNALRGGLAPGQLAQALVGSAEFAALHAGQNNTQPVTSFYEDGLGRAPDPAGLQAAVGALQAGVGTAGVLLDFATSAEAAAHLSPPV